jgi:hypothetical protein
MYNEEQDEWYWQTMANAQGDIENMPFYDYDPNLGLPSGGQNTNSQTGQPNGYQNYYGVSVPPNEE